MKFTTCKAPATGDYVAISQNTNRPNGRARVEQGLLALAVLPNLEQQ